MSIKPVLVPDHDAATLRGLMDRFADASTGPTRQQLAESRAAVAAARDSLSEGTVNEFTGGYNGGDDDDGNDRYDHSGYGMQNPVANKIARLLKQRQPVFYEFVTGGEPAQIRSISRAGGEVKRDPETGSLLGPVVFDIARKTSGGRAYLDQVTITPRDGFLLVAVGNKQVARRTGNPDVGMPDSVKQMRDTFDEGVAEGKKRSDRYHIVGKDGNPASLASYADQASAVKDRDEKHPGAEVRQVGPRGKIKGVSEGIMDTVKQTFNDCVVGYPMGTSDEQFIQGWARAIQAETGRDIPLEKLTQLYQDYVERSDELMQSHGTTNEESAESLAEFAPPDSGDGGGDDDGFDEDTLRKLAAQWFAGDEDPQVERLLAAAGWEIGQDEGYDDEPGVFVVMSGDDDGRSYMSWPAEELRSDVAEARPDVMRHKVIQLYES
jgi:hypothetical protein